MECINELLQGSLAALANSYDYISKPRGREIREKLGIQYKYDITAPVITLAARNMNYGFMFAEAAWILSGRNDLEYITKFMKSYSNYSDDGITLNGAYGPKVVDQLSWCREQIENDNDTRQAFLNIWRERPAKSKDIPCTTSIQFLLRDHVLHTIVNMRSQDVVLGFSYDVFVFSMIAQAMRLMLLETQTKDVALGTCTVNVGSYHMYEQDYDKYLRLSDAVSGYTPVAYNNLFGLPDSESLGYPPKSISQLINKLEYLADKYKR